MELHEGKREGYPSIKTLVTLGKEDLSIKVSTKKYVHMQFTNLLCLGLFDL